MPQLPLHMTNTAQVLSAFNPFGLSFCWLRPSCLSMNSLHFLGVHNYEWHTRKMVTDSGVGNVGIYCIVKGDVATRGLNGTLWGSSSRLPRLLPIHITASGFVIDIKDSQWMCLVVRNSSPKHAKMVCTCLIGGGHYEDVISVNIFMCTVCSVYVISCLMCNVISCLNTSISCLSDGISLIVGDSFCLLA